MATIKFKVVNTESLTARKKSSSTGGGFLPQKGQIIEGVKGKVKVADSVKRWRQFVQNVLHILKMKTEKTFQNPGV